MKEVILTPEGYEKLRQEIEYLQNGEAPRGRGADPGRPRVRRHRRERRVRRREERAGDARAPDRAARGAAALRARDHEEGDLQGQRLGRLDACACATSHANKTFEYHIVGSAEANPAENKLSNESPVGKAIMGHKKGDVVEVAAPRGALKFKILEIKAA